MCWITNIFMKKYLIFAMPLLIFFAAPGILAQPQAAGKQAGVVLKPVIEHLDRQLHETSGLIWFRNSLWTFNDSGGEPELYSFDPVSGKINQVILVRNALNIDWEDIGQDSNYIYIGDTGNNFGRRSRLVIYKISKDDVPLAGNGSVKADRIRYAYADWEPSFSIRRRISHDCEALFVYRDSIYVFTKNWVDDTSSLYILPVDPGDYSVASSAVFSAGGLITGADISNDGRTIVMIGYRDFIPFAWVLYGYAVPDFLSGQRKRFDFSHDFRLQTEGVAIRNDSTVYISSEAGPHPPRLSSIDLKAMLRSAR